MSAQKIALPGKSTKLKLGELVVLRGRVLETFGEAALPRSHRTVFMVGGACMETPAKKTELDDEAA